MSDHTTNTDEALDAGNAFERLIREHRRGAIAAKATEKLAEAIEVAIDREKQTKLNITIKITPQNGDQVLIDAEVDNVLPKTAIPRGTMFVDEHNCLHRSDPNQRELPLRELPAPTKELKEVPAKEVKGV